MSNAQSWAEDEVSDDEGGPANTPAEVTQDNLLRKMDDRRSDPAPRERRDLGGGGGAGGDGRSGGGYGDRGGDRRGGREDHGGDRRGGGGDRDGGNRSPRIQATAADAPMTGPFVAYVGNLSFQTTAQSIGEFFEGGGCEVTAVNMAEDSESGRSRGFAHVTFGTRESLIKSLEADGVTHDGRAIKVDINSKGRKEKSSGGFGDRDRGDRGALQEKRYRDEAPIGKSEAGGSWDRAAPKAPATSGAGAGRDGGYQPARDARPPREGGGMRRGDRATEDEAAGAASGAPATRPVINIAPRTKPLGEVAAPVSASASIFGEAKPRDASVFDKTVAAANADKPRKERKESDNNKEKKEIVFKEKKPKEGEKDKDVKSAPRDVAPIQRGQAIPSTARKDGAANNTNTAGVKDKKKDTVKTDKPKAAASKVRFEFSVCVCVCV